MDDKTRELLEILATKIGANAGKLSEHAVNYTYVCGWVELASGIILLVAAIALAIASRYSFREDYEEVTVITGLFALFALVGGICTIFMAIPLLVEPIGATIKGLL